MGLFFIVLITIALIIFFIFRLKISKLHKVLWSAVTILIAFSLIIYLFIKGFERGRDPQPAPEELSQSIK